ncbi:MAG TPA: alkaline phosphatase D family protein [Blastocatellia bacterium]|nr:alkaline phosphatase D family protein [Blastocatellia bacterium]
MKRSLTLLILVCIAAVSATSAQQSRPDVAALLRSGPMLGYSEMTETVVWLQTRRPCRVQLRFWKQGQPETARLSEVVQTDAASDHIARFKLAELEFGSKYDYEVYIEGHRVAFPFTATFQTQPLYRYRSEPPPFRFAIGSCAYINDPPYDRPGTPYGQGFEIFRAIAEQKPDFMIWLGDNIYFREADWLTESGMRYRYAQNRELAELQPLLATVHHYAIWDDHDFGPNNSDRTFRLRDASLRVFKDYWANQTYGTRETPGIFGRFEWADVEFFLLDDRYYRSPDRMPEGPDNVMLGAAQMRWLKESLRSSRANFKIVVGGSQMMNPVMLFEAFGKYPAEQKELLDFLRQARINGALFLSGDRHHTELIKRVEPGIYPLYDFTSSPLTSGGSRIAEEENNPARVPGTWVTGGVRNFGLIEVSGPGNDRRLLMRTLDRTGKELWRHEIKASELQFPRNQ